MFLIFLFAVIHFLTILTQVQEIKAICRLLLAPSVSIFHFKKERSNSVVVILRSISVSFHILIKRKHHLVRIHFRRGSAGVTNKQFCSGSNHTRQITSQYSRCVTITFKK